MDDGQARRVIHDITRGGAQARRVLEELVPLLAPTAPGEG
jgi:hypothetical protein